MSIATIPAKGVAISEDIKIDSVSLTFVREVNYKTWERVGEKLKYIEQAVQFWIGDWLLYGEAKFGEDYAQAVDETNLKEKTLRNYVYVASKVEPSRRREELTFTHHSEVASLPKENQDHFLSLAVENEWTSRRLRSEINAQYHNSPEEIEDCSTCGGIGHIDCPSCKE